MTDRIIALIKTKNLSPSQFAEEIGVQRSSISHLISGRNKPSLEFVQKIFARYPEINPEWLLNGKGPMMGNNSNTIPLSARQEDSVTQREDERKTQENSWMRSDKHSKNEGDAVEKIVFFYPDGTFREYHPE